MVSAVEGDRWKKGRGRKNLGFGKKTSMSIFERTTLSEVGGSLLRLKMVMYVLGERFVEL
jgi:hypothetical protein